MDIKHVLSVQPAMPAYRPLEQATDRRRPAPRRGPAHPGGVCEIGHRGDGFGFDNEFPRHRVYLEPFALGDQLVTCGEWLEFIDDGGYHRPELWLSDGWATVQAEGWEGPALLVAGGRRLAGVHPGRASADRPGPSRSAT